MAQCVILCSVCPVLAVGRKDQCVILCSVCPVLAVGRKDGSVCLHSVEDGHTIHELSTGAAVTSLQWTLQSEGRWVCSVLVPLRNLPYRISVARE